MISDFFKPKPFQEKIIKSVDYYKYNFFVKARQLGFTTMFVHYAYLFACENSDKNVVFVSPSIQLAKNTISLFGKLLKLSIDNWDSDNNKVLYSSNKQIKLKNGSKIIAENPNFNINFKNKIDLLILDEYAFFDNCYELWYNWSSKVSSSGKVIAFTSLPGDGSEQYQNFIELWKTVSGSSNINSKIFPWFTDDEKDYSWYQERCKFLGKKQVETQLDCKIY